MTTLSAISLHQPYATLIATPTPPVRRCSMGCENCDPTHPFYGVEVTDEGEVIRRTRPMVKRYETRSRPCPPKYIGQRIAIHAAKRADFGALFEMDSALHEHGLCFANPPFDDLPLGAVVATAIVTASLPIVSDDDLDDDDPRRNMVRRYHGDEGLGLNWDGSRAAVVNIADQLPYGDWTPGRWAWRLADVEPVDPPVPAVGRQGWFTVDLP